MRSLLALLACGLVSLLTACGSASKGVDDAAAATSSASATGGPLAGRRARFEIVATARVETASKVEFVLPVARSEPGVQEIEKVDYAITAGAKYSLVQDGRGNKVLRVTSAGPVTVRVSYRVARTEVRLDLATAEKRPLSDAERSALAAELQPTKDAQLDEHRRAGTPARRALGARVEGFAEAPAGEYEWVEVWRPGLAWVPYERMADGWREEVSLLPADVIVLVRGAGAPLAVGTVDGVKTAIPVAFTGKLLEAP